jgi:hypothetical protein
MDPNKVAQTISATETGAVTSQARFGVSLRVFLVAVVLTIVAAVWVAQVELILHTAEISESVPLIASLAGLFLLVLHNRVLQALEQLAARNRRSAGVVVVVVGAVAYLLHMLTGGGLSTFLAVAGVVIGVFGAGIFVSDWWAGKLNAWQLERHEIVLVYCFLTLSALMMSAKVSGYLVAEMTVYNYFGFQEPHLQGAEPEIPAWLAIKDDEVVRTLYEGSNLRRSPEASGMLAPVIRATEGLWWPVMQVPWGSWLVPVCTWIAIMFLVFLGGFCVLGLMKRYWTEKERLSFPLIMIPLEISSGATPARRATFLDDYGFWVGFGLSGLFTFYVVMHALSPSLPAFQAYYSLAPLFREHPWSAVQNASIHIRPEIIGLSYFIESSITFTIWVSAIFTDLLAVLTRTLGYETRHFPQPMHQGVGSYVILGLMLVWSARAWVMDGLRAVLSGASDPKTQRVALLWLGLVVSMGALLGLGLVAGMKWWASVYLFGTILAFFLLYGRVRAETGVPHASAYPRNRQMEVLKYLGGPKSWAGGATPALFGTFWFIGGGYTCTGAGAQIENLKIADEQEVRQGSMTWLTLVAPVVGLVIALVMRLAVSYHYGLNCLEGGVVQGGYPVSQVTKFGGELVEEADLGVGPSVPSGLCAAYGAVVTLVLVLLRREFLRFPLHPLGYGLAMMRLRPFWAPFLFTWTIKTLLLKIGGARAYRRAAPAFLGLAIGHYFFAGIMLGCLAAAFPWLLEKITVINFD